MKIKEFVDEYNKIVIDNLKKKYIKDTIEVKDYINFDEKCKLVERVVKSTTYEFDENGNKTNKIKFNTLARTLLLTLSVIDNYTNLDVDFDNISSEYDILTYSGIMGILVGDNDTHGIIPYGEIVEIQAIMSMMIDDIIQNEMSMQAFIQKEVSRFGELIGFALTPLIEKLDDKAIEKIGKQLESVFKK